MHNFEENEPPLSQQMAEAEQTKQPELLAKIKNYFLRCKISLTKVSYLCFERKNKGAEPTLLPDQPAPAGFWPKLGSTGRTVLANRYIPHLAVVFLGLLTMASNINDRVIAQNFYKQLVYTDSESEYSLANSADEFTPLIGNDAEQVKKVNLAQSTSDGFVSNVGSSSTELTAREAPLPDNSQKMVKYTVRNGDTLTGIGWKFDVRLASLKFVNDLSDSDKIRPGTELKIPPKGYEVSKSALAKKEKEKQTRLALSNRSTLTRNTSVVRAANGEEGSGSGNFIVPISHNGITRGLGRGHTGIDYRANLGTAVRAADDGVVSIISTGWSGGYGNEIVVNHGGGVSSRYAHLSTVNVEVGQRVSQGEVIAASGNTGRSTGPHLHFEKIINGRPVNPF